MRCTLCGWVDSHDPACMWIGPRDPAYLVPISDEGADARLGGADLRAALVVVREQLTRLGRLHVPGGWEFHDGTQYCAECGDPDDDRGMWPCATARILAALPSPPTYTTEGPS